MINKSPKFSRLLQVDYPSAIFFLMPVLLWCFFIFFTLIALFSGGLDSSILTRPNFISSSLVGAVGATILLLPLLYFRYRRFQKFFSNGIEITGKIEGVGFNRERGAIEVSYHYKGKILTAGALFLKSDLTKDLKSGKDIVLVVDPATPKKAYIKDLYL